MMGLEEHLLTMFRGDFEFHDGAGSSHLGAGKSQPVASIAAEKPVLAQDAPIVVAAPAAAAAAGPVVPVWAADAEKELKKIPFFVRGKARRNTERFSVERGVAVITVETLYDAKAHFGR
jgi:light-independent protochlorophyllide reductase subunit B